MSPNHVLAVLSGVSMIGLAVVGTYATRSDVPGSARPFGALACLGGAVVMVSVVSASFRAVL